MNEKLDIIIVDDEISVIEVLKENLDQHNVEGFTTSREAIEHMQKHRFDMLILDYYVDELNGKDIVKKVREFNKEIYIILLTGYSEMIPGMESLKDLDIQSYIEKTDMKKVMIQILSAIKSIDFLQQDKKEEYSLPVIMKELRKSREISQEEIAKYLGVTRGTIANYEAGISEPSLESIRKLAIYFKVSTDYILGLVSRKLDNYRK